ncbi:MAG: hypothetical protein ABI852_07055 [Gemmatimonadaceae bacterium]
MRLKRIAATTLAAVGFLASAITVSHAQTAPTPTDSISALPLVFLDCQAQGCDEDFLRTELTWMNFVRDRNRAMVHIIATSRSTASGGAELSLTFERTNATPTEKDSLIAIIPQSATNDQSRRVLSRAVGQGMLRFIRSTTLADQLTVSYKPTTAKKSDTRGAKDKWHLWVYRVSTSGFTNGDENYKSLSVNSSVRASRTTEKWKSNFSVNANYRENSYTLSEDEKLRTYQHGWSANLGVVKSLSPRWSLGATTNASSSVQSNQDLFLRIGPAIEFDVFPYSQSTRRQIIFRYTPGVRTLNYTEYTIYDKLKETHPDHQFLIGTELTQKWGSISANTSFNQLLDDLDKANLEVGGYVSWRIVTGLNLNIGGSYERIRNQSNLKRGAQEQQEVLLQLRQLRTGYSYYADVGLSFTFGSIFQNVVNPRLSLNNFF